MKSIEKKMEFPEPTDEQIKQTQKAIKNKFDIKVPKKDAFKLVNLMQELKFYHEVSEIDHYYSKIDDKSVEEYQKLMKEKYDQEISMSEAREQSQGVMVFVVFKEKDRLATEMREILTNHREVKYEPILLGKTAKLFKIHYNLDLPENRQKQLLYYISKNIWYKEGLEESVEKCLDELIMYADKRKRGKKISQFWKHKEIKQDIDWAVIELKLIEGKFDPLYRALD